MNILVLSAGRRNKIIEYFKRELQGNGIVVATDCSELAPALYEADKHYIVPRITEDGYIDVILDICKKEKISGVMSLIDPELELIAKHREDFLAVGTVVVGSDCDACGTTFNKYAMYQWLCKNGYNCAKTYIEKEAFYEDVDRGEIAFPVFVKPVCGSASVSTSKVHSKEAVDLLFARSGNLIIQEFLNGEEIGADCYIDIISGEVVSIFTKKKIAMRAGETDKSVSFKDERLFELIKGFCSDFGFAGQIDIDIFDINGEYYISEVNPRFGGGYPHAYECGANHMNMIINNLQGKANANNIGNYKAGIYMMKYSEIKVMEK